MIATNDLWLPDLERYSISLERRYRQKNWSPSSLHVFEKEVCFGFYAIRRLIESSSILDRVSGTHIRVMRYPARPGMPKRPDFGRLMKLYDLFHGERKHLSLRCLCNQFVHSRVFSPFIPVGKELVGIYFGSDESSATELYYLQLVDIVSVFQSVVLNRAVKLRLKMREHPSSMSVDLPSISGRRPSK